MVCSSNQNRSKRCCKLKFKEEQNCKRVAVNPCFSPELRSAFYPIFFNLRLHFGRSRRFLQIGGILQKGAFQTSHGFPASNLLHKNGSQWLESTLTQERNAFHSDKTMHTNSIYSSATKSSKNLFL